MKEQSMKTTQLKRYFFCGLGILMISALTGCQSDPQLPSGQETVGGPTSEAGGSGVGNGGSAFKRNGMLLTFAQMNIQLEEPRLSKIDGLKKAIDFLDDLSLPADAKGALMSALQPSESRRYFNIKPEDLSPVKRDRLLATYIQELGSPVESETLQIVAITVGEETFLLPEFYQLTDESARAAMLLHESLWVANPKLRMKSAVLAEIELERVMRSSPSRTEPKKPIYDYALSQALKTALDNPYLGVGAALLADFHDGPVTIRFPTANSETIRKLDAPIMTLSEAIGPQAAMQMESGAKLDSNLVHNYFSLLAQLNPSLRYPKEFIAIASRLELARLSRQIEGRACFDQINPNQPPNDWPNEPELSEEQLDLLKPYTTTRVITVLYNNMYSCVQNLRMEKTARFLTGYAALARSLSDNSEHVVLLYVPSLLHY